MRITLFKFVIKGTISRFSGYDQEMLTSPIQLMFKVWGLTLTFSTFRPPLIDMHWHDFFLKVYAEQIYLDFGEIPLIYCFTALRLAVKQLWLTCGLTSGSIYYRYICIKALIYSHATWLFHFIWVFLSLLSLADTSKLSVFTERRSTDVPRFNRHVFQIVYLK